MTTSSSKSRKKKRVKSGVKPRGKNTRQRRNKNSHIRNKNTHRKRKRGVYRKKRLTHRNKHKKTHNNKETNCKSCFVYKGDLKQKGGANNIKVTLTDAGAVVTRTAIKTGDVRGSSAAVNKKMKDVLTTYCVVLKKFKKTTHTINYGLKDFIVDKKNNPEYLKPDIIGKINIIYGLNLQTPQLTGNEFHKWMMGALQEQLEKEYRPSSDQLPPAQHPFKPRTPPSDDTFKAHSFEAKHNIVPIEWHANSCYFDSVLASFLYYPNEFMYNQLFTEKLRVTKDEELCFKILRKLMYELYTTIHVENSTGSEVANKRDTLRRGYRCQSNLIKSENQWWNQQPLDSMEFLEFSILPFFKEEHYHIIHLQAHKDELLPLDPITEKKVGHNTQMVIFYMDRNPGTAGGMITTAKSITTSITLNLKNYKLHSIVAANGIHNTALLCDYDRNLMYYNDIPVTLDLLSVFPRAINEYFITHSQIYIYIKE